MTTRTERFQRKPRESQNTKDEVVEQPEEIVKFSPEEEAVSPSKRDVPMRMCALLIHWAVPPR